MATDVKNDASLGASLTSAFCISATVTEDSKGTNTLTDNNTVTSVAGKQDDAVDFESTASEYLSIADGSQTGLDLDTGSFSVAVWVKPETISLGYSGEIVSKHGANATGWFFQQLTSGVVRFVNDGSTPVTTGASTTSTGVWSHIVVTYDGTNLRMYFDGSLVGGPTSASNPTADTSDFRISSSSNNPTRYYDGVVNQVLIYSKNLTSTNVTDLYNSGTGIPWEVAATNAVKSINGLSNV